MAQIPNYLDALPFRSLQHGEERRPIVNPALAFNQVPAQAVAHCSDANCFDQRIIGFRPNIVLGAGNHIQPRVLWISVRRALESAHPKRTEN